MGRRWFPSWRIQNGDLFKIRLTYDFVSELTFFRTSCRKFLSIHLHIWLCCMVAALDSEYNMTKLNRIHVPWYVCISGAIRPSFTYSCTSFWSTSKSNRLYRAIMSDSVNWDTWKQDLMTIVTSYTGYQKDFEPVKLITLNISWALSDSQPYRSKTPAIYYKLITLYFSLTYQKGAVFLSDTHNLFELYFE